MPRIDVGGQVVMTAVEILDQGVSRAGYPRWSAALQLAHGPQSRFQAAVVCLDRIVGVLLGDVTGDGQQLRLSRPGAAAQGRGRPCRVTGGQPAAQVGRILVGEDGQPVQLPVGEREASAPLSAVLALNVGRPTLLPWWKEGMTSPRSRPIRRRVQVRRRQSRGDCCIKRSARPSRSPHLP